MFTIFSVLLIPHKPINLLIRTKHLGLIAQGLKLCLEQTDQRIIRWRKSDFTIIRLYSVHSVVCAASG